MSAASGPARLTGAARRGISRAMASSAPPAEPGFAVYVHWPFCLSKCP